MENGMDGALGGHADVSSAGSNEPERPVFDPLNADLCDPEMAILSAVSRR